MQYRIMKKQLGKWYWIEYCGESTKYIWRDLSDCTWENQSDAEAYIEDLLARQKADASPDIVVKEYNSESN